MITRNIETLRNISVDFTGTNEELNKLIFLLEFELNSNPNQSGIGLSAIQINIPFRVAIIRAEKKHYNLYNAKIIKKEQEFKFKGEGCLSFPNLYHTTKRYNIIEVQNGNGDILKFSGFMAVVVQHELDHWEGIIFTDRIYNETI